MTIELINNVIQEFSKRLQLPESKYSFAINKNEEMIEFIIFVEEKCACAMSITNGTLRVVYDDKYGSISYSIMKFLTPITLLYYLCILFFSYISEFSDMSFNDIMSVILLKDIRNWKDLLGALSENCGMSFIDEDSSVLIDDVKISYDMFSNKICIDSQEIFLNDCKYVTLVEAIFKSVEYVANIMGKAEVLFDYEVEEYEDNIIEDDSEMNDVNIDINMNENMDEFNEVPPVEPMENETFEEPQESVVEVTDLIE